MPLELITVKPLSCYCFEESFAEDWSRAALDGYLELVLVEFSEVVLFWIDFLSYV